MLNLLHIENIAVIEKADIEFGKGLSVLTGETGAGKSIIIDSINAILGERTSHDLVRSNSGGALVTALFTEVNDSVKLLLEEAGYESSDELLITKKISVDGKSTIKINGVPATTGIVKTITQNLININGQHSAQLLLLKENHLKFLDKYADSQICLNEYQTVFEQYKDTYKKLKKLNEATANNNQRIELLKYEIDELEQAEIEIGEIDSLKQKQELILNSENIAKKLSAIKDLIDGNEENQYNGLLVGVDNCEQFADEISKFYNQFEDVKKKFCDFKFELEEIDRLTANKLSKIDYDPAVLEQIGMRLDYLYKLSIKYGKTEEEMLDYLAKSKEELDSIENVDKQIEELTLKLEHLYEMLAEKGAILSDVRNKAADKLSDEICKQLDFLDMPKVKFVVSIKDKDYSKIGKDDVEFLISTNIGEPLKPLAKIASGGELSRIMLAVKSVLNNVDDVETLIFDEVDTGISGSAAQKVGKKLKDISVDKQTICVTHLAQIAALADNHYKIEKTSTDVSTKTNVTLLDKQCRIDEVARIISAGSITENSRKFAEELINNN